MPRHSAFIPAGVIPAKCCCRSTTISPSTRRASARICATSAATEGLSADHHQCAFDRGRLLHLRGAAPRARDRCTTRSATSLPIVQRRLGRRQPGGGAHRRMAAPRAAPRRCWCSRRRRSPSGQNAEMALAHFKRIADAEPTCRSSRSSIRSRPARAIRRETLLKLVDAGADHPRHQGLDRQRAASRDGTSARCRACRGR